MANYYTLTAICVGNDDFDTDEFNEANYDLCEVVRPTPKEIQDIHIGSVPTPSGRRQHWRKIDGRNVPVAQSELAQLDQRYGCANWREWGEKNWGTTAGAYNAEAHQLGGDCKPVVIEAICHWDPPSDECLKLIDKWLRDAYGFTSVLWVGCEPRDDSLSVSSYQRENSQ